MTSQHLRRYRFRAECQVDVDELRRILGMKIVRITMTQEPPFPDVDVELETALTLEELRAAMLEIIDGHTMVETVAASDKYTGERNRDWATA